MRMQQLRYFLAVLDHGGFSRAATHLGRTQQAVSKALGLLEDELGVRLLDRGSGVPQATAFGRELERFARGVVRDGVQSGFAAALRDGALDLALYTRVQARPDTEGLHTETLMQNDYRVLAGRGHPLAQRTGPLSTLELAGADWLLGSDAGDIEAAWREAFESAGVAPPTARCSSRGSAPSNSPAAQRRRPAPPCRRSCRPCTRPAMPGDTHAKIDRAAVHGDARRPRARRRPDAGPRCSARCSTPAIRTGIWWNCWRRPSRCVEGAPG